MPDSKHYPDVDLVMVGWLCNHRNYWEPAQYSTRDQLLYLIEIAHRFGLYDAADYIKERLEDSLKEIIKGEA